ncbi:hypothetical protein AMAG_07553 [Allomyces macrogynus ATCC 38327]|uniref:RNA helicase n=1 Tax=Allomyces macrogynus (strain ATCC 38327) TaxID=578462 RepID=A0A0L0SIM5_ALLM3|nr:hypothetical protein AMAG_07553 [Allomyces macrogynus ATCC 38327]|eukprot:KNE62322.1 hypothetical protein AMAG_07553 [Allomyces macrogynus ATCC 38327]
MLPAKRKNPLAESDSDDDALNRLDKSIRTAATGEPAAKRPSLLAKRFPVGRFAAGVPARSTPTVPVATSHARTAPAASSWQSNPTTTASSASAPAPLAAPALTNSCTGPIHSQPAPRAAADHADNDDDDDDDPLDAFMANVNDQATAERARAEQAASAAAAAAVTGNSSKRHIVEFDDEDDMESYVKFLHEQKRVRVDEPAAAGGGADADSDDEVYRVAESISRQLAEKGQLEIQDESRDIDPLKPIDHGTVEYAEFEKDFYEEHEDVAAMTPAQVTELRRKNDIRVWGPDVPRPCVSFAHFGFDEDLVAAISRSQFESPTAIQMQAVPLALSGRDIIGVAATGSGKTLAFVWPLLVHAMDQPERVKGDGPIGLILAPTRELALQIAKEAKRYAKVYGMSVFALTGGANKADQWKALRAGVDVLIATPGRLIEMIKNKATNLRRVTYLVLDEADRMLEQGFEPQVLSVCTHVRPDRQTLLFSATFPRKVETLANTVTNLPVKIVVGGGSASQDVTQIALVMRDEEDKFMWVLQNLDRFTSSGSVVIFATKKAAVDDLVSRLRGYHVPCLALHGDLLQPEREHVVHQFKTQVCDVLVATDVAARGLDIRTIRNVINYDPPRDMDTHTHRVGRTGRAGERGTAYTLVLRDQGSFAADLVTHLEASAQDVPSELVDVAMTNPRFAKARRRGGVGAGRGGGARGRGGGHGGRGRGRRGRGQGLGGTSRSVAGTTVLSATSTMASSNNAASMLMAAFRPSSKVSEMALPNSLASRPAAPPPSSPAVTTDHARPASPMAPTAGGERPNVSETSDNPLLAALARHRKQQQQQHH